MTTPLPLGTQLRITLDTGRCIATSVTQNGVSKGERFLFVEEGRSANGRALIEREDYIAHGFTERQLLYRFRAFSGDNDTERVTARITAIVLLSDDTPVGGRI